MEILQIQCTSGEEWTNTLFKHYPKDIVQIRHNPYNDILTAIVTGNGKRSIWIGKFDNTTCKGVVVDRRSEIRNYEQTTI